MVEKLIAHPGIDVNAGGATGLYIAAEQVREGMLKLWLGSLGNVQIFNRMIKH